MAVKDTTGSTQVGSGVYELFVESGGCLSDTEDLLND